MRDYLFLEVTSSLCSTCLRKIDAKVIEKEGKIYLHKRCPSHGFEEVLVATDAAYWKMARNFVKPSDMPLRWNTEIKRGCPYDCGLCPDHEQHSCLTLLEITEQCNLSCPVCFAGSGPEHGRHRSMEEIEIMIEAIIANEGRPDIVQISGGEPTIHPNFFDIVEWLKNSPVRHVMINTNGVKLMDREFVERLASYKPGIEIYLQFDSLRKETLEELRGGDLRKVRQQAIDNLNEFGLSTTLVVTLKKGLNDQEIGEIMDYAVKQPAVRGITFQPIQIAGRLESFNPATDRLTLTEVRNGILQQSPIFSDEDVLPVPCHPDCLAMAYALKVDGEVYPLTGLIDKDILLEAAKNTIILENDPELLQKGLFLSQLKNTFSLNVTSEQTVNCLSELLCCLPKVSMPENLSYDNVFRVIIMQFLDAYNFDVRSVKKSCVHIAHPDGRILPFDTYNLFYREGINQ